MSTAAPPHIVHETDNRIRFRWNRLLDPGLRPEYLEAWLCNLRGVTNARVNPQGRSFVVEHDGDPASRDTLLKTLPSIPAEAFGGLKPPETRRRLIDVLAAGNGALLLPLLPLPAQAAVATAMGLQHILRGVDTLVNEGLKVRVLDMTTIGASLLRADYATAASISAMVVLGEYLKTLSDDKSNALLKRLIAAPVDSIWVERDGQEVSVGFDEVATGEIVVCGSGELVGVDGEIVRGKALVDNSSITGESAPRLLDAGDRVSSGSVVVEGTIRIRAQRTGRETDMARIAELMTRAVSEQSEREIQSSRLADRLAPITLGLGAGLYLATNDLRRALSVLTVDFACAVKFPAPLVVKTSMHAAAKQGVVIKSGRGLEALGEADCFVFDKTGTLTLGELDVTDIFTGDGTDEADLLCSAAAVEDRYGHPMGRALIRETTRRRLTPPKARSVDLSVAHGVSGMVGDSLIRVGSHHFIQDDCGVDCSLADAQAKRLRAEGKSLVFISRDDVLLGMIALMDTIRPEAADVVAGLRENGARRVVLLTGDHKGTAKAFAERFPHVDSVHAGLTPEDKARIVEELRESGHKVAMVGDGVNDAPAFTAADVGVCMSRATGLARDSAQIVLNEDSLSGLATAFLVARRAHLILRNCFNAGVGVNSALLLAAGAGLVSPIQAAAIHNGNTFAILGAAAWAASREIGQQ
ncbi:heavy metal translocating P-type ATPase [Desulfovibrio sp. Huiquan2017]|uniref:heavy metal translocating P-type ATPase n=1 Tax=Desulfovibrio sp. Huiquan2017 TaxID=2816861 RepID=UPI001A91BA68